jgi:aryl-alcohol dehydrogenase-like predicted oxidoreductase
MEKEVHLINLLKGIAEKHNSTLSQIAIAWILQQPGMSSAIIGTQNQKHFIENIQAIDVKLSEEEVAVLKDCSETVIESLRML